MSAAAQRSHSSHSTRTHRHSPVLWTERASESPTRHVSRPRPVKVTNGDAAGQRLLSIRTAWSDSERENRRLQAMRKQDELLMMMAIYELEDVLRVAVADGELPMMPPEIETGEG